MTSIAPGGLVTCRQTGTILYVVVAQAGEGICSGGRSDVTGRTACAYDLVQIRPTHLLIVRSMKQ